jgi:hypothetical protein
MGKSSICCGGLGQGVALRAAGGGASEKEKRCFGREERADREGAVCRRLPAGGARGAGLAALRARSGVATRAHTKGGAFAKSERGEAPPLDPQPKITNGVGVCVRACLAEGGRRREGERRCSRACSGCGVRVRSALVRRGSVSKRRGGVGADARARRRSKPRTERRTTHRRERGRGRRLDGRGAGRAVGAARAGDAHAVVVVVFLRVWTIGAGSATQRREDANDPLALRRRRRRRWR